MRTEPSDSNRPFTLIGSDIDGPWNRALLTNAAAMAGSKCIFARTAASEIHPAASQPGDCLLESELSKFRCVLACESTTSSVSIYDLPAPREKTAVVVGNEERGIPRKVLKQADRIISVPMIAGTLTSLNVAAAGAIILYALTHDFARRRVPKPALDQQSVDLLVVAPADPHELGSLLRSARAFGWRRVYLSDPHQVWFSNNPELVLQSRAAARRAKNNLAVLPAAQLNSSHYDSILVCDEAQAGLPLSRLRIENCGRLLAVIGSAQSISNATLPLAFVTVDHVGGDVSSHFRLDGSIFLSRISQLLSHGS